MKILFWLGTVVLIPVYVYLSFFFQLGTAVGGYRGALGTVNDILWTAGMLTAVIGMAGLALGVYFFVKKKKPLRAFACMLAGLIYALLLLGGAAILDAVHTDMLEEQFDRSKREMYGEDWDAPSRAEGIPGLYGEILSQVYVMTAEEWNRDQIMATDLFIHDLPDHYGDNPRENIGYALMDLNNDASEELLIGVVGESTKILSVYTDPENPFGVFNAMEGEIYYLHAGADEMYQVEISGVKEDGSPEGGSWILRQGTKENGFDFDYAQESPDAAGRMTVELTPFAAYR